MSRILTWDDQVVVTREPSTKMVIGRLLRPHRVMSTSPRGGGTREDVTAVYNHQSCEPAAHHLGHTNAARRGEELHIARCVQHGLDPDLTVSLGTAANMRCLGVAEREYRGLRFAAVCTAGVEGNAGRAGDPASSFEVDGRHERVGPVAQPEHGTIVTMLLCNQELTAGALARTLMTATEAKTALLQDLVVGSLYSEGRATGTGTDQFFVACPTGDEHPLTGAGKHSVAGQLVAEVVREAIAAALVRQNGLEPSAQCSLLAQYARFGLTEGVIDSAAREVLTPEDRALLTANLLGLTHDPHVVAAAAGLAEVVDQVRAGVLPRTCLADYYEAGATLVARAASGGDGDPHRMRRELVDWLDLHPDARPAELVARALCLGFGEKWRALTGGAQATES